MQKSLRAIFSAALAAFMCQQPVLAEDLSVAPVQHGYVDSALVQVAEIWETTRQAVGAWTSGSIPTSIITRRFAEAEKSTELDFRNLMDLTGYSGLDIRATVGVLPRFSTSFNQRRQMSASDRTRLLRLLRKHERAFGSPVAIAERLMIYSILEINSSESIELKNVVITVFPLPSAEFIAGPKSKTGLGPEAAKLSSEIQSLKTLIQSR